MRHRIPLLILLPTLYLLVVGLVMQGSISPVLEKADINGKFFHLWKQARFVGLGILALLIFSKVNPHFWMRRERWLYWTTLILLALCFAPGVGATLNNASRWIRVGTLIQPSEIAKFTGVVFAAAWSTRFAAQQRSFLMGFLYPCLLLAGLVCLIAFEVDLGNAALVSLASLGTLYLAGTRARYLIASAVVIAGLGYGIIQYVPAARERLGRLAAFQDMEAHKTGDAQQQYLSLKALRAGGDFGVGLGNSSVKHYGPGGIAYSNTDFVFPIIGEEMGLIGTFSVQLAYGSLLIGGLLVSYYARDRFCKLLAFGLITVIVSQALLHQAVCLGKLPNKGTALPFISAGGTNLIMMLFCVGVLISIHRRTPGADEQDQPYAAKASEVDA
jgi:cell division protein FtsW